MTIGNANPPAGTAEVDPKATPVKGEEQSLSDQKPTYFQKDMDEAVEAAKTQAGREGKAAAQKYLKGELKTFEDSQAEWHKQTDEAELAAIVDDPAKVTAVKLKQTADRRVREAQVLERKNAVERALLDADLESQKQIKLEVDIWEAAKKAKVDPTKLKEELNALGITDQKRFAAVAKRMPEAAKGKKPFDPDDGEGGGSGDKSIEQKLNDRYPTMK